MEKTVKMFPKRIWGFPRKFVVVSKPLCDREFQKLKIWLQNQHQITIHVDSKKKICLINETLLKTWEQKKLKW